VEADRFPQVIRALRNPISGSSGAATFLSNIGTWMQNVAQGWLVLLLTGNSAFWLGVVGFAGSSVPLFSRSSAGNCRPREQTPSAAVHADGDDAARLSAGGSGVSAQDQRVGCGRDRHSSTGWRCP